MDAVQFEQPTRLLVVDDHPIVCQGLAYLLHSQPDMRVEWQALGVEDALRICRMHRPDMALVDIILRDGSGIELIKELCAIHPGMLVLALSMHDESLYMERVLRAGGRGYITKWTNPARIVEAIRRVREGNIYLSTRIDSKTVVSAISPEDEDDLTGPARLTDREFEIFELVGAGLKTGEIALRLHVSVNTVGTHCANIKSKLNIGSSAELAKLAVLYSQKQT